MSPELTLLGFRPFFEQQLAAWPVPPLLPARVAAVHRSAFQVWAAAGPLPARMTPGLRRRLGDEALPGVGDWVVVEPPALPSDPALLRGLLERQSVFTRGAAGRATRVQVVAANVDRVFVVLALDAGVNLHTVDRYLACIWAGGAEPRVVLNKADLVADAEGAAAGIEVRCPGVQVHCVSALRAEGLEELRTGIPPGCTVALVGPSGAGKSTLANALLGEERLATGEVQRDRRGRHTTTRRELVLLPGGGLLLDTPGMRELQVIDEEGLETVFADIAELAGRCRFRDCTHEAEPGCAVQEALAAGTLEPERLEHFRTLAREAAAYQLRHDVRARREAERAWGRMANEVLRQKYGRRPS